MARENFCVARVATRTRTSVGKFERHIERLLRRNELLEAEGKQFDVIKKAFGTEVIDRVLEQELVQKVGHKAMKQNKAARE